MSVINAFLMGLPIDVRNAIWNGFIVVFAALFAVVIALYARKTGRSIRKSVISAALVLGTYIVVLMAAFVINTQTNAFVPVSGNVYFLPGVFACGIVLRKYLRCSLMDALDLVAISFLLPRTIHLFGCAASGCCQGAPVPWGIYSALSKTTVVPVNEIEAVFLFAAWYVLNRYYRKNWYMAHGKAAAYAFVAYGMINFVSDIFTVGLPKLIFMTSMDGIVPFLTAIVGLILLYIVDNKKTQETSAVTEACTN